ncbi:unnamed protein product, partial [Urochloa humidicola]
PKKTTSPRKERTRERKERGKRRTELGDKRPGGETTASPPSVGRCPRRAEPSPGKTPPPPNRDLAAADGRELKLRLEEDDAVVAEMKPPPDAASTMTP